MRPGDEVIVFAPVYDSYLPAIALQGGTARIINLQPPTFRPDWTEVAAAIGPRTRLIILNTPHNPTGTVWTADDMQALAKLVRDTDIVLLGDEVYEHIVFADSPTAGRHESLARLTELRERSFVVSSFGKTFHITGWKVAYCAAPAALMAEFRKAHQFIVFTVHHPSQMALADFMRADPGFAAALADFYRQKRDEFRQQLAGIALRVAALRWHLLPTGALWCDQRSAGKRIRALADHRKGRGGDSGVGLHARWQRPWLDPFLLRQERSDAGGGGREAQGSMSFRLAPGVLASSTWPCWPAGVAWRAAIRRAKVSPRPVPSPLVCTTAPLRTGAGNPAPSSVTEKQMPPWACA